MTLMSRRFDERREKAYDDVRFEKDAADIRRNDCSM